jgi:hypothetical protein
LGVFLLLTVVYLLWSKPQPYPWIRAAGKRWWQWK